ncbi:cytochrome c oxidase subunit 3 [Luteolibacter sp. SL250]|uniref:cytochrome c oxidase subunit 3 n=1 Tax=Luteolibacter sp. SL250 TaxID=2995170 RepID=UPI00226F8453|nr:cytochrome c oxidase subunit 3 [Luteolibacter sp. SL250]WAC19237.1 cytochrome c oxidase subunit 3 [Luteolibacter sp. SL250]
MEIPYIVTPRKDTGLFNSKIAIWLFLASEVMLFGGFFSAYVFLRIGADYPWPERTLPVLPGLINTFVLIGSSVTVVFAWAALKMREWRKFQIYMWITILCAGLFMVLKGIEYSVKFGHQAVRLNDYSIVEGHLGYEKENGEYVKDYRGKKIEENQIVIEGTKFSFSTVRYHGAWVKSIADQAKHHGATVTLAEDVKAVTKEGQPEEVIAKAGEPLTTDLLSKIRDAHLKARKHNGALRTAALRKEWKDAKAANPDETSVALAPNVNVDAAALAPKLLTEIPTAAFNVSKPVHFLFAPRDIREADGQSRLRDDTVVEGKLLASPMVFHYVDAIDFQHLAMKAKEKGIDPEIAIDNSWLMKNDAFVREIWEWHRGETAKLEERLLKDYGLEKDGKTPKRHPTWKERYRVGWDKIAEYSEQKNNIKIGGFDKGKEHFFGPNYTARNPNGEDLTKPHTFPHLSVPRGEIRFASKFTPSWNTYYAIYFTITGLHGLHVVGGAIVLGYYLFCGRKMYLSNPEWLANRVEVGGLFWHFVDLVWIFVFPVLYLM